MKKTIKFNAKHLVMIFLFFFAVSSCKKYLDIIPDNVATIDGAFNLRNEAEKFLFSCYSYLPKDGSPTSNIAFLAGDESWLPPTAPVEASNIGSAWQIARGSQNTGSPLSNFWDGENGGGAMFKGIRQCNIFLENVRNPNRVYDLSSEERKRWIGEAEFLKAYYHFVLLRMYGPIPIIDKNLEISALPSEVKVKRMPFTYCVDYIANLLDSASDKLGLEVLNRQQEYGRITKPIALSVKAKVLVLAASPLFNGNSDYANFKDKDGELLFPGVAVLDLKKWERAAIATKEAILSCEEAKIELWHTPPPIPNMTDTMKRQMIIRESVTRKGGELNRERVWGFTNSLTGDLQYLSMGVLAYPGMTTTISPKQALGRLSAPMKMAELFYTRNGVPIDEDKYLDFSNKNQLRTATEEEKFHVLPGYQTARLNFDREPRFYADLGFDGGAWFMQKNSNDYGSDKVQWYMKARYTDYGNDGSAGINSETGYFLKKVVEYSTTPTLTARGIPSPAYEWPAIRLADLYLLYAEALNESIPAPSEEVFTYIDRIRERAGLLGVKESWSQFTNNAKYQTKAGMRSIIRQERGIELAFEGSRFWDIMRWKIATEEFNETIRGWSISQSTAVGYYQTRAVYQRKFVAPRDYLWPIKNYNILVNPKLVQNPGW